MSVPDNMLINGESTAAADGARIEIMNPATEEVVGRAPEASAAQAEAAAGVSSFPCR